VKILIVSSYPPRHCGIGAYARDQVARLRAEGHDVTVLSPPDGDGDSRVAFLGGRPFARAARMGRAFDRIVVHFQPALYYAPRRPVSKVMTSLALWRLVRSRPQTELIVHEADPPIRWRPDYALLRATFRSAGRVLFHTESERRELERQYGIAVRGELIPHMVTATAVDRQQARDDLGISRDGPVFVCAGFLQPSKGFDRAVEAFARGPGPDAATLYIVGSVRDPSPENQAYTEALRERCGSEKGVRLLERYVGGEEFDRWIAAADWLVLPYRRSWSSGVLARAHALGTPAIVSSAGGLAEQAAGTDLVFDDDEGLIRAMKEAAAGVPASRGAPAAQTSRGADGRPARSDWDPEFQPPLEAKGRGMLFLLILVSVAFAALAQLTLKHGMTQVTDHGAVPLDLKQPVRTAQRIAGNVSVLAGLGTFVFSAAIWLLVLSRVSLSFAYPFVSLTYVIILVFDRVALHEQVTSLRWAGVALIVGGILLVSRTHQTA
jgi:glycosyltransferase involved in cell wall biosynthesis/multidrug transporter EmrE-like cation transporter